MQSLSTLKVAESKGEDHQLRNRRLHVHLFVCLFGWDLFYRVK